MSTRQNQNSAPNVTDDIVLSVVRQTHLLRYAHITAWGALLLAVTNIKTAAVWYVATIIAGLVRSVFERDMRQRSDGSTHPHAYALIATATSSAWAAAPLMAGLTPHPFGVPAMLMMVAAGYILVLVQFRASPLNAVIASTPYSLVVAYAVTASWGTPSFTGYVAALPVLYGAVTTAIAFGYLSHVEAQTAEKAREQAKDDMRAAKETAERASRIKTKFLANTSHEVRTPLNGILGMAQIMRDETENEDEAEKLDVILDSGRNLLAILNNVLDVSKVEAGATEIVSGPVDIRQMSDRLHGLWAARAQEKSLTFSVEMDDDVPDYLELDEMHLRQCLNNLLGNALKFTSEGRVHARFRYRRGEADLPDTLFVEVVDSGIGITDKAQDRIFEAFTQDDASRTREFSGTGLGLTITRSLARMMGGDVSVASTPGAGSVFTLSVATHVSDAPAGKDGAALAMTSHADAGAHPERRRYLVADDNQINRTILRLVLEKSGAQVDEAVDGIDAVQQVRSGRYDAVFMDIHMPRMDGVQAIAEIRSLPSGGDVPILAVTADAMKGDRERYLGLGADGYVSKPIQPHVLSEEIARLLPMRAGRTPRR